MQSPIELSPLQSRGSRASSPHFFTPAFLGTLLLALGAGFFLLLSVGLWYLKGILLSQEQKLNTWVKVEAICTGLDARQLDVISVGNVEGGSDVFVSQVGYRYTPPDSKVSLEGTSLIAEREFSTLEEARAAAHDFAKVGDRITVYYNPAAPGESSLYGGKRETNTGPVLSVAMSVTSALGLACLSAMIAWRRWWSTRELADGSALALLSVVTKGGFGAVFTLSGLIFFLSGAYTLWEAQGVSRWQVTEGIVLSSRLQENDHSESWSCSPKIRYSYQADGYQESEHIFVGAMTRSYDDEDEAEAFLEGFPVGAKVKVYYDPKKPSRSALIPESAGGEWIAVMLGGVALAIGLAGLLAATAVLKVGVKTVPKAGHRSSPRFRP